MLGRFLKSKVFLEEIMKPKFYKRCQSTISVMKFRLQTVRRKKKAVIKFLKTDITDLLKTGLDYNAYARTEGLIEEKKRLSCYDLIEQFCDCVFANLSLMLKQNECPEECREAVSSLIYAAARVPEVPELKDLRALFTEKYEEFTESSVNQELIEKLEPRRASRETKIQTMREIAREFSIFWESRALQQMLLRQSSALQIEQKDQSLRQIGKDQHIGMEKRKSDAEETEGQRYADGESGSEDESVLSRSWRRDSLRGSSSSSSSQGSLSEDETDAKKKTLSYRFIPPPYTKPGATKDKDPQEKQKQKKKKKEKSSDRIGESVPRSFLGPQVTDNEASSTGKGFRDLESKIDPITDSKPEEDGSRVDERSSSSFQRWKLPDYDELVARVAALRRR